MSERILAEREKHYERIHEVLDDEFSVMDVLSEDICRDIVNRRLGRHKRWSSQKRRGVSDPMPVQSVQLIWESRHGQNDVPYSPKWEEKQQERRERKYLHAQGQNNGPGHVLKSTASLVQYPEIGLIGHANCGKSALLNVIAGTSAETGVAGVNSRSGWTENIKWYKLKLIDREGPTLMLVDMPGKLPCIKRMVSEGGWTCRSS